MHGERVKLFCAQQAKFWSVFFKCFNMNILD